MEIGKIIKENRTAKNMTQEDLANEFFVSRPLISKWENSRSYPDLEQLIKLSDFFDLTLDELMRGDKKMTKKLNWDTKKKKVSLILVAFLTVLLTNYLFSLLTFNANPNKLEVTNVKILTDKSYPGGDPNKDWNSIMLAEVHSKNIFFKPDSDSFLTKVNKNEIIGSIQWSFNIFNIFKPNTKIPVNQTFLLEYKDISFKLNNSKETIPFESY